MGPVTHRHLDVLAEPPPDLAVGASLESSAAIDGGRDEPEALLQVGDLARATGKTVRAIHLYEDMGLLRPADRSKGRYRLFSPDSVIRVRWITKLQSLGLSLGEIQELVREQQGTGSAMFAAARLRDIYARKLEETRTKIAELATLESELEESLAYLGGCDTSCMPELPTQSCSRCDRRTERADPPDLVAGVHAR